MTSTTMVGTGHPSDREPGNSTRPVSGGGDGDADGVRPGVLERDLGSGVALLHAPRGEALAEGAEILGGRHRDRHLAEAERRGAGAGARAVPGVHAEVVVVAAGGYEERGVAEGGGHLEADRVDVEGARRGDVADLEMHVADARVALDAPFRPVL